MAAAIPTAFAVSRPQGLAEEIALGNLGQFPAHEVEMVGGRNDVNQFGLQESDQPFVGLAQQALATEQAEQLLGSEPAAQRPQARSRATGHDHGMSHIVSTVPG